MSGGGGDVAVSSSRQLLTDVLPKHLFTFTLGVVAGAGGVLLLKQYINQDNSLVHFVAALEDLRHEVAEIRSALEGNRRYRGHSAPWNAGRQLTINNDAASTDDDTFEDAYSGYATPPESLTSRKSQRSRTSENANFSYVDSLYDGMEERDKVEAYYYLKRKYEQANARDKCQSDPELLWRLARSCLTMAELSSLKGDEQDKKQYLISGKEYAELGLQINTKSADLHKWYAIVLGTTGQYEGNKEKIKNGFLFKEHISYAIDIRPDEPTLHHLLGRWCYEVAMLSWIERKLATTLVATPPNSTIPEALTSFQMAENLQPDFWKANQLYIAKCYLQEGDNDSAIMWLEKASQLPIKDEEDRSTDAEVNELLLKYR